ncbi:unnamed protein product [Amaranthus hypochondriacus]
MVLLFLLIAGFATVLVKNHLFSAAVNPYDLIVYGGVSLSLLIAPVFESHASLIIVQCTEWIKRVIPTVCVLCIGAMSVVFVIRLEDYAANRTNDFVTICISALSVLVFGIIAVVSSKIQSCECNP